MPCWPTSNTSLAALQPTTTPGADVQNGFQVRRNCSCNLLSLYYVYSLTVGATLISTYFLCSRWILSRPFIHKVLPPDPSFTKRNCDVPYNIMLLCTFTFMYENRLHVLVIAMISIARYLIDKGENTVLYRISQTYKYTHKPKKKK